ncbi:HK97 family phage prohead protease [Micromonospora sp. NPDC048170]|uniref:HK97 family phage prohead protease n=1 Tax=Micromonospora sp. NPDC048170 TaxID=3154819 RepID=UPI0033EE2F9C
MGGPRLLARVGGPVVASAGRRTTRSGSGGGLEELELRFSPFNKWYEVYTPWEGRFLERTVRGAFAQTIQDLRRSDGTYSVKTLFNHGADPNIGGKLLGTTTYLAEEADSPAMRVALYDTSYNRDLLPGLKAGAYGSSFMFAVDEDTWDHDPKRSPKNPNGLPERTIRRVTLYEAGPVTFPANPAATAQANGKASVKLPRHRRVPVASLEREALLARFEYQAAKANVGGRDTPRVRELHMAWRRAFLAEMQARH